MTLQSKLKRIGEALTEALGASVYHYWRPQMQPPFCVWAEDAEDGSLDVDNRKAGQTIVGYVDYYTKTEYDPALDTIQEALDGIEGAFGWTLDSVQYEDDTGLIHYQWHWSVA